MSLRFRVWMPIVAVLLVLLSVATLLLYALPTVRARLGDYIEDRNLMRAAASSEAVARAREGEVRSQLELSARAGGGQVFVVGEDGAVTASVGPELLPDLPENVSNAAASGRRMNEEVGGRQVAVVPLIREGNFDGGVVYVAGDSEGSVYEILLRSGIEAAVVASILSGGLALLLAAFLSQRIERLTAGARSIESGDLSFRIKPGFRDELGDLAVSFNSMAGRLEESFARIKENGATQNAILNNLSEGVMATDLRGHVMFVNLPARSMLNLGSEGPLDEPPDSWSDLDLPDAIVRCAGKRKSEEIRVDDEERHYRVKLEHMPRFDDHRGGVLVIIQDLSESRRLEANQQRFLANAAHELKTPITTILGAAELLLTDEKDAPEIRQRFLKHISTEAERMRQLSETLLKLARTGADFREPDIEPVDLTRVARETAQRMEPLARSANLVLRVEGHRAERVRADREWLEQCLLALLGNAVQHAGRKGDLWIRLSGGKITVEDEGFGIDERDLPHVFERFYRNGSGSGSFGLGLPICKELVERMGGCITLHSERDVGTRVDIELPEEA